MVTNLKKFDYAIKSENLLSEKIGEKKKAGRKPLDENIKLTQGLRITLNQKDFEVISEMANENGIDLSGFARMILKNYIRGNTNVLQNKSLV